MHLVLIAILLWGSASLAQGTDQVPAQLVSQARPQKVLTLRDAVEQALKNSPDLAASSAAAEQARFDKYVSRSKLLPTVNIQGSAEERKDAVANRTPGSTVFGGDSYRLYTVGIRAEQTLLAYGFFAAAKQGGLNEKLGETEVEIGRRDISRKTIEAYYRLVMTENLVRVLQDQEKAVREILGISKRRMGLGGKRLDYLQVQTNLAVLVPKIIRAKNELAASTAELAILLGLEGNTLAIGVGMPELALKDVTPKLNLKDVEIPELSKVRLQRQVYGEQRSILLGKNLPQLKLVGAYGFLNYTKAELFDSPSRSWTAGLVLDIPLFSGLSLINERRSIAAQETKLEAQERGLRNTLASAQIVNRAAIETAEASLQSAVEGVRLAKSAMAEARQNYSVGLIDFVQYNTVQQADFDATTTLLQTRYDAIRAYANYFMASGQPLSTLVDLLSASESKL